MSNVNISYQSLHETATKIQASREQIHRELDGLRSKIEQLVSSGFVTQRSSSAFLNAFNQYNSGAKKTIDGLDQVITYLNKVEQTYRETDQSLANAIL